jgi:hypothetical protein
MLNYVYTSKWISDTKVYRFQSTKLIFQPTQADISFTRIPATYLTIHNFVLSVIVQVFDESS